MSPIILIAPVMVMTAVMVPTGAAVAHHGWTSYDESKTLTITAPLTALSWGNPHSQAQIDYRGQPWTVVLAPVLRMESRGLSKEMLAPGKPVTLVGYPRSDGSREMRIEHLTVDGKTIALR